MRSLLLAIFLLASRPASPPSLAAEAFSVQIRPVRLPSDLPSIRACRSLAFQSSSRSLLRNEKSFVNATAVAANKSQCLVAVSSSDDTMIHGTVDFKHNPRTNALFINNVFVAPNCRGQGIGRRLMRAVELQAQSQRLEVTQLQVYTSSTPAMALYRSSGYRSNGIHAFVEAFANLTGANLLVTMTKQLQEPSPIYDSLDDPKNNAKLTNFMRIWRWL
jgi:ribosomal protein S18 acetylase RimI-like enzyme